MNVENHTEGASTPSERHVIGVVYSTGEYSIEPEHIGVFPPGGRNMLRLRQDRDTRNLRRTARTTFSRDAVRRLADQGQDKAVSGASDLSAVPQQEKA